jgi:hypothetical protein
MMQNHWPVAEGKAIVILSSFLIFWILLTKKLTVEKFTYVTVTGWYHRNFQYSVPIQLYFSGPQTLSSFVAMSASPVSSLLTCQGTYKPPFH